MCGLGVHICDVVEGDAFVCSSRSFIDVPYMVRLTNLRFLHLCHSMAGASLTAYTLQARLVGDPHLPIHSPSCRFFVFVSRCLKRRRCKIASAAYIPGSQCLTKPICGGLFAHPSRRRTICRHGSSASLGFNQQTTPPKKMYTTHTSD